jgi:hypothetical protein
MTPADESGPRVSAVERRTGEPGVGDRHVHHLVPLSDSTEMSCDGKWISEALGLPLWRTGASERLVEAVVIDLMAPVG